MKGCTKYLKQFLLKLLTDNHSKRMSANEALKHPFILSTTDDEATKTIDDTTA